VPGYKARAELAQKYQIKLMDTTPLRLPASDRTPYARTKNGQRISRFVFTLPNWTQEEYEKITSIECKWMVVGKEVSPETGTPHLQGACILGKQMAFSTLKTLIGSRCHIEHMRGKPESSLSYCSKEDLNPFVKGTLPTPGKRNDIHIAAERIVAGESVRDLAHDTEVGAVAIVKYYKGLTVLRSLVQPVRTSAPNVIWLYGPTGTGKTRCALESGRRLSGSDSDVWISSGSLRWFDGYDGQPVALLDDFRSKDVRFAFFLRLLDRYPMSVEFKGGFVNWIPSTIFITCPYDPVECFATRNQYKPEDIKQLQRRIKKVIFIADPLTDVGVEKVVAILLELCGTTSISTSDESDRLGGDGSEELSTDLAELGSSSDSSD